MGEPRPAEGNLRIYGEERTSRSPRLVREIREDKRAAAGE